MSSALDRVREVRRKAVEDRLVRGAAHLGLYWMSKERCKSAWAKTCACAAPVAFCNAKKLWAEIFVGWADEARLAGLPVDSPWWVIEAMTLRMLDATALTLVVQVGKLPPLRFGPDGTWWGTWYDIIEANKKSKEAGRETWRQVANVQKVFTTGGKR